MKYRIRKKKIKQDIIKRLYAVSPQKNDILVMEFTIEKFTYAEVFYFLKLIKTVIKDKNKLIALPNSYELKAMDKRDLKMIRERIDELLKQKNK